jgi:hypothetical protein
MPGRLIVEHLDGETLVYDTASNEAHALSGAGAAEFLAADEVSRREVLRKLALAGAAAAGTGALVKTIVAPTAALAQSPNCGTATCGPAEPCCTGFDHCCDITQTCCGATCCNPGQICSGGACDSILSSRNLKRHLAPVGSQDMLAALGL